MTIYYGYSNGEARELALSIARLEPRNSTEWFAYLRKLTELVGHSGSSEDREARIYALHYMTSYFDQLNGEEQTQMLDSLTKHGRKRLELHALLNKEGPVHWLETEQTSEGEGTFVAGEPEIYEYLDRVADAAHEIFLEFIRGLDRKRKGAIKTHMRQRKTTNLHGTYF